MTRTGTQRLDVEGTTTSPANAPKPFLGASLFGGGCAFARDAQPVFTTGYSNSRPIDYLGFRGRELEPNIPFRDVCSSAGCFSGGVRTDRATDPHTRCNQVLARRDFLPSTPIPRSFPPLHLTHTGHRLLLSFYRLLVTLSSHSLIRD